MMITTRTATRNALMSRMRISRNNRPFWSSSSPLSFSAGAGMSTDNKSARQQQQQQDQLTLEKTKNNNKKKRMKIAVIGGGLAGLLTVYHLLEKTIKKNSSISSSTSSSSSGSSTQEEEDEMMTIQKITIWDCSAAVGVAGGASAVAGGLVHPLSPSGKLVHWGMQGLDATRRLVNVACRAAEKQQQQQQQEYVFLPVVLRHEILRLALTPQHVNQLVSTERAFSSSNKNNNNESNNDDTTDSFSCRWLDAQEIAQRYNNLSSSSITTTTTTDDAAAATNNHDDDGNNDASSGAKKNEKSNKRIRGGLLMSGGGCQVLHVPSYLQALWLACLDLGQQGGVVVEWKPVEEKNGNGSENDNNIPASSCCWSRRLADYDTIVLAAGSGMFGDLIPLPLDKEDDDDESALPVHLVRGQSIEMDLPLSTAATPGDPIAPDSSDRQQQEQEQQQPALLCGKYVSPLPPSQNGHARILIGATHEFKANPLSPDQVVSFLRDATAPMVPSNLWQQHGDNNPDDGNSNGHCSVGGRLKITSRFRVQSQRGKHGRMPIIGRYRFQAKEQQGKENDAGGAAVTRSQNKYASWCHHQDQNMWIFTGLSSRGLLYHALYGDLLTDAILANDEQVLWARCPDLKWWQKKK